MDIVTYFNQNYNGIIAIVQVLTLLATIIYCFWLKTKFEKEAEKIKYEMQRKYLHLQIKTTNLLEIYPKLYLSFREAGTVAGIFETIAGKINELPIEKRTDSYHIKILIDMYFHDFITQHEYLGLEFVKTYTDQLEASSLFISNPVLTIANEGKQLFMSLHRIVRNEIANNKYQSYTYEELLGLMRRANAGREALDQIKNNLQKQMYQELNP